MGLGLVVVIPMLGRAHRVAPLLESIHATCQARPLFCCTEGDDDVTTAVDAAGAERIMFPPRRVGDYAAKVNAAYRYTSEPLIFVGACDLRFHPGWFEAATARLDGDRVGVVGTNDLGSPRVKRGVHATHCLVTRDYVDRFGTIDRPGEVLHEGYVHEYVDDELVGTAKMRRAWAFAADSRVEHLHPNWCPEVPTDPLYDAQAARMKQSRALYQRRMRMWT
jgi:glycosyltransferase involved in cell wall biosynthesis